MTRISTFDRAHDVLKIGDTVTWRGGFGLDAPVQAEVTGIVLGGKHGHPVAEVPWRRVHGRSIVLDLDKVNSWAYGYQIEPGI